VNRKAWARLALGLLVGFIGLRVYAGYQVYTYASVRADVPADAAIVLGAAVWEGEPSPVFEERIKHAVALYRRGRVQRLIFTGGVGLGDQTAEAEVARQYAVTRGVPAEHIHCETSSRVTYGNLRGARSIMERQGLADALIVSDPLHMRRAVQMARDLGIEAYSSPTPTSRYRTWRTKLGFLLRESRMYARYLLRRPFMSRTSGGTSGAWSSHPLCTARPQVTPKKKPHSSRISCAVNKSEFVRFTASKQQGAAQV
jgi:uncharacterized SAM-binding protein YcdF (DUF218 family)